ncbi:leucine-rich repeat flightless-interacting protein 2 isoform X6 [Cynoglossus semilaevis]|uniref:Leucine-rich repeat flightless-interacting protein 2-like n=1 Tax=Cynoglossus semilaevis TaxID=244447 RepID=A0A3P8VNR9_CYNSE|nr:leucine-rich repeat flightless-interacting protein 2-like isoform X6 [Cynoglossus semilaevis]
MGTQGPGRKRIPNRERLSAEDDALNQVVREAEARLAAKRAARAEARDIRMKELEKHQHREVSDDEEKMSVGSRSSFRPSDYSSFLGSSSRASSRASSARASPVVEDRGDRDFLDKASRTASTLSTATLASLGGASSRRGSCDTNFSVETEASVRDMKDALVETEEKYRKAMVFNAQLHNQKSALMYQVDALKEELMDLEEELWEERRRHDHALKEFEQERASHNLMMYTFKDMKESLRRTEELLRKHQDVIVSPDVTLNQESELVDGVQDCNITEEAEHRGRESMLEPCVKKLLEDRQGLEAQVKHLQAELQQHQEIINSECPQEGTVLQNGVDSQLLELQRETNKQISELKFKLVKSEQDVATLEQNVIRLEGQVTRYRSVSERSEASEDELKVEKRKLQRELRAALDRVHELEVANGHLTKRLEKMKANRTALLAQQ